MKEKKATILPMILWIFSTGMWIIALFMDLYHGNPAVDMVFLHTTCSVMSLAAAIFHIKDYIRQRK